MRHILIGVAALTVVACSHELNINPIAPTFPNPAPMRPGPFQLTFSLDASFQGPHGGQAIAVALVRSSDGEMIARANGTVSAAQDPSFVFVTGTVMQRGTAYEAHYWIDSNIGGGTLGVCDPKAIDHQWSVEFPLPSNDVSFVASHSQALTEDVCQTFSQIL